MSAMPCVMVEPVVHFSIKAGMDAKAAPIPLGMVKKREPARMKVKRKVGNGKWNSLASFRTGAGGDEVCVDCV